MTALVTENMELLASATDGVAKLRSLILDLAIRGRLVPQDSADEPASTLLSRIASLKAGRPPKSGTDLPAEPATAPHELPQGWVWTMLRDVAIINPRNQVADQTEVSFVPMAAITTCFVGGHAQEKRRWSDVKTGFTHFAEGDIGVAKITPCFENSKACVFSELVNGLGAGTTELHIVRPFSGSLAPRYVLVYLKSPWFLAIGETKMTGTAGQKRLPKDFVEQHPFPLPPLAEQHRIVAKVDELMALCNRLEARQQDADAAHAQLVQVLLDSLTQARDADEFRANWQRLAGQFHALFTTEASIGALKQSVLRLGIEGRLVDHVGQAEVAGLEPSIRPFAPPPGWVWRHFGTTWDSSFYGPRFGKDDYVLDVGVPTIRTTDMSSDGRIELRSPPRVVLTPAQLQTYGLRSGDLLVTRSGSIGTMALFRLDLDAIPSAYLIRIRFLPTLVPEFGLLYLRSPGGQEMLGLNTTSVGVPNVNATKMAEFPIAIPSIEEQQRIVAKVTELLALCDQLKARIAAARKQHGQLAHGLVEQALAA